MLLLVGLGSALGRLALPRYVASRLETELARRGLDDVRFEIGAVGLHHLELRHVKLAGAVDIDAVDLELGSGGLFGGHLESVSVRGRLRLDVRRLGTAKKAVRRLLERRRRRGAPPPFERLAMRGVEIEVDAARRRWRGRLDASATLRRGGARLELAATAARLALGDGDGAEQVSVGGRAQIGRSGIEAASLSLRAASATAGGVQMTALRGSVTGDGRGLDLALAAAGPDAHPVTVDGSLSLASRRPGGVPFEVSAGLPIPEALAAWLRRRGVAVAGRGEITADARGRVAVSGGELAAEIDDARIGLTAGPVGPARELTASLRASGRVSNGAAELALSPASSVAADLGRGRLGPASVAGGEARFLAGAGARVAASAGRWTLELPAARISVRRAAIAGGGIATSGLSGDLPVSLALGSDRRRLEWRGGGGARAARVRLGEAGVVLEDVRLRLPEGVAAGSGRLRVASTRWRSHRLPSPRGRIERAGSSWRFVGSAPLDRGRGLAIEARATAGRHPSLRLEARTAPVPLRPESPLGRLARELIGAPVAGRVGLDARVAVDSRGRRGDAVITVDGASIELAGGEAELRGVEGRLALSELWPLAAPHHQLVTFRSARIGRHALGRGAVHLGLDRGRVLAVDGASMRVGGGLIAAAPFRVDLDAPEVATELSLRRVEMADWLPALSGGRVAGRGRLSGRVDVAVSRFPRWAIRLGDGRLVGDGGGRLRIDDPAVLRRLIHGTSGQGPVAALKGEVRQRVISSLSDLDYAALTLDLNGRPWRGPDVRIRARGTGHRVDQPVDVTVDAAGVDTLINSMLPP